MEAEERQFLLTMAWMLLRHGQGARARILCEALVEDDPHDGVAAVALAERQLEDRQADMALQTLRNAIIPRDLERAAALLETRALCLLDKRTEANRRWQRYVASHHGRARAWLGDLQDKGQSK